MAKIFNKTLNMEGNHMEISNMKNMVILKNLPSNIVDEAIVILKSNKKVKKLEFAESKLNNVKTNNNDNNRNNDYIVNEAEMVISNYISNLEKPKEINSSTKELKKKYSKLKKLTIFLGIITIFQIILMLLK